MTRTGSAVGGGMIYSAAREHFARARSWLAAFSPDRRFWLKLAGTLQVALATQVGMLGLPLADSDQMLAAPGLLAIAAGFIGGVLLLVMGFTDPEPGTPRDAAPAAPPVRPKTATLAAGPLLPLMGLVEQGLPSLGERIEMELRRPLTAILGFATTLEGDLAKGRLADGCRDAVQRLKRGGNDLLAAVDDLAAATRASDTAAAAAAGTTRTGLRDVVGDALGALEPMARRSGVRLVRQDDGELVVLGARDALGEVLMRMLALQIGRVMPGETIVVSHVAEHAEARLVCRATGGRCKPAEDDGHAVAALRTLIKRLGGRLAAPTGRDAGATIALALPLAQARRTRAFRLAAAPDELLPHQRVSAAPRPVFAVA